MLETAFSFALCRILAQRFAGVTKHLDPYTSESRVRNNLFASLQWNGLTVPVSRCSLMSYGTARRLVTVVWTVQTTSDTSETITSAQIVYHQTQTHSNDVTRSVTLSRKANPTAPHFKQPYTGRLTTQFASALSWQQCSTRITINKLKTSDVEKRQFADVRIELEQKCSQSSL